MSRCQDPIRLGPAPKPNGNGSCSGLNVVGPPQGQMAMGPAHDPSLMGPVS
jgi:hypothetical protein